MKVQKLWLFWGISIVVFLVVAIQVSHSIIAVKNVLNMGISVKHIEAGPWEKEASKYKDEYLFKTKANLGSAYYNY